MNPQNQNLALCCGYQSRVLRDHSADGLRSGEGTLTRLKDGALLLIYSEFPDGGKDDSSAFIAAMKSADDGETWSGPEALFHPPEGALNVMSASLLRLQDDRLALIFCVKYSLRKLIPFLTFSGDEGQSWSEPRAITQDEGYFVVNSDRLVQQRDGTLLLPYAHHIGIGEPFEGLTDPAWNARCGLFYSRDLGRSWKRSEHEVTHTPEIFHEPLHRIDNLLDHPEIRYNFTHRLGILQEPGVQELGDGSLMLYMRSSFGIYRCFSDGPEAPWGQAAPIDGFHVCTSPATLREIPGTKRLIMLYNDRGEVPYGSPDFSRRTPLSVAISDDFGRSWQRMGSLEGPERNYCYFSLHFHGDTFYTTYYESALRETGGHRNLASLKFGRGSLQRGQ